MSRYAFTCPDCGQEIEVNESMREATLAHGCPVCGSDVTADAFVAEQTN
ncbi:zinc ribbon domain-containing protein [Salinadaptatus halalkaliphilus]|uniref:Zinc ribbon domain-containing protein n=1 Tax=Salinadaptatus halalkaliphilus TaxID=2419781 RepID=A0A4S3TP65_9EURY|nr:FmdB family zinc ribbon protein [Salinadaptatus halalkaliphilus]THE66081.1 zinc ribbon domain-containing protein [Salinadaptatus halalkaliphilus]